MGRSYLEHEEPLDALCHHFNVRKITLPSGTAVPTTLDMPILRDAHMPTHVLVLSSPKSESRPLIVPVNTVTYSRSFRTEIFPLPLPGTASPIPHFSPAAAEHVVTLPAVPLTVPHVESIPLLLLFGLGLEDQTNFLAWRLLPAQVVEEFPNAAAMAQIMARMPEDQFQRCFKFNQGMWQNVLALGYQDSVILGLIQTAWNVTAEARRIRLRTTRW